MRPFATLLLLLNVAGAAPTTTGRMCDKFFKSASGCGSQDGVEAKNFDEPVQVWNALQNPKDLLLVFFHGHGGSPKTGLDFQQQASSLGFDVISLDFAYGVDYDKKPKGGGAWTPADANCDSKDTCGMSLAGVCGCYTECYGQRWDSIWQGGSTKGLPTVTPDWTINARLQHVVAEMAKTSSRYNKYLDSKQKGGINWSRLVLAGHSLGASLAAYIGKHEKVSRVVMMSGTGDTLAPHNDMTTWSSAFGCRETTKTDHSGCEGTDSHGTFTFTNCSCSHTTYRYGVNADGTPGDCKLSTAPVAWVADHKTPWATPASSYYGFQDSDDETCNWLSPGKDPIMTQLNWAQIGVQNLQIGAAGEGLDLIGVLSSPTQTGIVVYKLTGTPKAGQICDALTTKHKVVAGHDATISDSACSNRAADAANRLTAWTFILTH